MKTFRLFIFGIIILFIAVLLSACAKPAETPGEIPADNPVENASEEPVVSEPLIEEDITPLSEEADEPEADVAPERYIPESGIVNFSAEDGLTITADLYKITGNDAPYILLFHQAGSSRGEYIEIAPRLNVLGFNCLAIDQRAGGESNEVENMSARTANKIGLETSYTDAWLDVKAALLYAKDELQAQKIIIWGSSYSAALVFALASEFPEDVSAVLAFSPAEYFELEGKKFSDYAANVICPVLITAEADIEKQAKGIYNNISYDNNTYFTTDGHGSSVLWSDNDNNEQYWQQVIVFLGAIWSTARF
jgi:pimeloyl-ACP methyl ester carboxylesterase